MSFELADRRVMGAVQPVDVNTKVRITGPFSVSGDDLAFQRNRSGFQVIVRAKGFEKYAASFDAPVVPAAAQFPLTAGDPSGRYLPRKISLDLPRDLDPKAANTIFKPVDIEMYPSPSAPIAPGLAVIRAVILKKDTTDERLPWTLVRVKLASDGTVLARALADWRGEVLVGVPKIALVSPSEDDKKVVASDVDVTIDIIVDSGAVAAEILARKQNRHALVNPDDTAKLAPAVADMKRTLAAGNIKTETWEAPFAGAGLVIQKP